MFRFPFLVGRRVHVALACCVLGLSVAACGSTAPTSSTGNANNGGSNSSTTGGTSTTGAGCTTGNITVNGVSTEKFCGPAQAHATYQGQTFTWSEGSCFVNQMGYTGVNIGHEVLDPSNSAAGNMLKQQYDYFGAEAQASKGGTYQGLLAGYYHGQDITSTGNVTLNSDLKGGSFSGKTILGGVAVTASWTC